MIKLFEEYKNDFKEQAQDYEYVNTFVKNIIDFFNEIKSRDHKIQHNIYSNSIWSVSIVELFLHHSTIYSQFEIGCKSNNLKFKVWNKHYSSVSKYIENIISPYYDKEVVYKDLANIKFSKEDYKIYKEGERFGL